MLGPNGAGKTTSFLHDVGLISPGFRPHFARRPEITSLPMYQRARLA